MRYIGIPRNSFNLAEQWHFVLLIGMLVIIAWVRMYYDKRYTNLFKRVFNARYRPSVNVDDKIGPDFYTFVLNSIFVVSLGFMLFQADKYYQLKSVNLEGWFLLIFYCFILVVIFSVKLLAYSFNGFIFDMEPLVKEYIDYIYLNLKALGLIVLPLNVLVCYADKSYVNIIFIVFYLLYGVFWLLRITTGMLYGISANISMSYLFLYLCTLEILPVLLLIKLLFTAG